MSNNNNNNNSNRQQQQQQPAAGANIVNTPLFRNYLKGLKEWQSDINVADRQMSEAAALSKRNSVEDAAVSAATSKGSTTNSNNNVQPNVSRLFDSGAESIRYKELGNEQFKLGKYKEATEYYTLAIQLDSTNAVLYSNRAMSYLKLKKRAQGHKELKRYQEALADFTYLFNKDPKNKEAETEIANLKKLIQQQPTAASVLNSKDQHTLTQQPGPKPAATLPINPTPTTAPSTAKVSLVQEQSNNNNNNNDRMEVDSNTAITAKPSPTPAKPVAAATSLQERLARLANMKPPLPKQPPRNSFEFEKFYNSIQGDNTLFYNYFKFNHQHSGKSLYNELELVAQILDQMSKMNRLSINVQSLSTSEKQSLSNIIQTLTTTITPERVEHLRAILPSSIT
ncbi:hypothetical protein SAMD00019534_018920 [Acytostelium subglobosum LB1]|uniref:hypothetical protein n=1 Tax=Acytostelium subglobosum LB1 TaxID=1410327 RepID=UPI00064518D6|nr:hypothetical protein SAMD00019534_018920 [Acytostelium subglobosum LB1]GAM18717.1 hypothetical protein SAMD00019534_018920 [Acytostelium subglobosum LB1]|eukprot:XP_012757937.1 hypothetical protein SAMD00019534_018920 [Acytostelium subglobosum LB1]